MGFPTIYFTSLIYRMNYLIEELKRVFGNVTEDLIIEDSGLFCQICKDKMYVYKPGGIKYVMNISLTGDAMRDVDIIIQTIGGIVDVYSRELDPSFLEFSESISKIGEKLSPNLTLIKKERFICSNLELMEEWTFVRDRVLKRGWYFSIKFTLMSEGNKVFRPYVEITKDRKRMEPLVLKIPRDTSYESISETLSKCLEQTRGLLVDKSDIEFLDNVYEY